ncbi:MAG: glycosyltransferase family 39 protein [Terracidiphilus sp.]
MSSRSAIVEPPKTAAPAKSGIVPALVIASAYVVLHLFTNYRFSFHRDELQFLSDAMHLDWGFVAYPPLTPFLARVAFSLFGPSLEGLRIFSVAAMAIVLVISAKMAKELGGGRLAQVTAALVVGLSPYPLFEGTEFQYTPFDYLWWVLAAYFTILLLKSENPRWWLAIGAAVGLGLLTKYSILFLVAGILAGVVLSSASRYLRSGWFWGGLAVSLLIFLPDLLWEAHHKFVSYAFLQSIHARDVKNGISDNFLGQQLFNCVNPVGAPLCLAGLIGYLRSQRYRMLGWMYLVPLALFVIGQGRSYYLAPVYPMLIAMGAVIGERWYANTPVSAAPTARARRREQKTISSRPQPRPRRAAAVAYLAGIVAWGVWVGLCILPLETNGPLRDFEFERNSDLHNRIGWTDLVQTVANIRDSLSPVQKAHLGILVGNYGEQGAFDLFGPAYHLPEAIGSMNSAWYRGYPTPQPTTLIVVGFPPQQVEMYFTDCNLAGVNGNLEGVVNEESRDHPYIFVCGPPKRPWPEFWANFQHFG